jgi:hypothetical protein
VADARRALGDADAVVVTVGPGLVDGVVRRDDLAGADGDQPVAAVLQPATTVRPGTPLDEVDAGGLLVVTTSTGRLVGTLTRPDGPPPG